MAEDKARARYRAVVNLDYPAGKSGTKHVDPGKIADDIPAADIKWMLEVGAIVKVDAKEGED